MNSLDLDLRLRIATFDWLAGQVDIHGDVLPRQLLQGGFIFEGQRVPLISPQGIHKPRVMDLPLTITTTPNSPYSDSFGPDGLLTYKYRGTDPNHPDNAGLRRVMAANKPLAYFHGIVPGQYLAVWPVYLVGDNPAGLSFQVAVDDIDSLKRLSEGASLLADDSTARRAYITSTVKQRLHQRSFREKVLQAYRSQCAFCQLRHRELLDAAHIIPDQHPDSRPSVDNGLSLCKLHHAAFDSFILGVSPDYVIHVRGDILAEDDGPMLRYGLQGLHQSKILLPSSRHQWPNAEGLAWRYRQFTEM